MENFFLNKNCYIKESEDSTLVMVVDLLSQHDDSVIYKLTGWSMEVVRLLALGASVEHILELAEASDSWRGELESIKLELQMWKDIQLLVKDLRQGTLFDSLPEWHSGHLELFTTEPQDPAPKLPVELYALYNCIYSEGRRNQYVETNCIETRAFSTDRE